jgi:uncharacterized membrane protein
MYAFLVLVTQWKINKTQETRTIENMNVKNKQLFHTFKNQNLHIK